MGYQLRDGVSFCCADGRTIFLKLGTGRYSSLSPRTATALQLARAGDLDPEVEAALVQLKKNGLIEYRDGDSLLEPTKWTPARESVLDSHWRTAPHTSSTALIAIVKSVIDIKMHPLSSVLGRLTHIRRDLDRVTSLTPAIEKLAIEFVSARLFLPLRDRCLAESVALVTGLARNGIRASLVFGVSGRPFAAHCWVEMGETILNDTVEHVSSFRPILYS